MIPLAFAFSKPVIVSDVGELGFCTRAAEGGIVLQELNPQNLGKQILWMLEHKEQAQERGKNGRKYTEEVLGWEGIRDTIYGDV
ncbi:MAG: hypothetical protein Q4B28_02290 [bacterium]|nr:hypothetical protein [bacterium]